MRPQLATRFPVHLTVRLEKGLPSLRRASSHKVLKAAFAAGKKRFGFRLIQYSIQSNHLHLIAEAKDKRALTRGMKGLLVRVAKRLNRLWRRRGKVIADRFQERILRTPREVRNALLYVLNNARRHGVKLRGLLDAFASGRWFGGFRERGLSPDSKDHHRPVAEAHTWLVRVGWRRHGLIGACEVPQGARG